ncbi:uncharacterized protein LOC113217633 [Frankliniella occidentalis]|uniref:Uncharacterized protein LOC113217633 n=1 Tax=Frankliniella occidentalis TaxID=133901 RepID=A0A6J1TKY5_FRAOC|nr:uncharacterized protein LOC113217633 [Frankliniella occidentalis]
MVDKSRGTGVFTGNCQNPEQTLMRCCSHRRGDTSTILQCRVKQKRKLNLQSINTKEKKLCLDLEPTSNETFYALVPDIMKNNRGEPIVSVISGYGALGQTEDKST